MVREGRRKGGRWAEGSSPADGAPRRADGRRTGSHASVSLTRRVATKTETEINLCSIRPRVLWSVQVAGRGENITEKENREKMVEIRGSNSQSRCQILKDGRVEYQILRGLLTLNIEICRRELGGHEFSPRLQLQLLVVGKTSGTSLPLGEQRAPDYRGYRSPSLSASVLLAGSPSIRSPRGGGGASPLDTSQASSLTPPPKPPNPLPPKRTTSALPWSSLRPLRWSGDPYGPWVDFVFWW